MAGSELIKYEDIQNTIYTIRGVQVMLDEDLALLYGVETKVFNQAVKRNSERFPEEFMFQITDDELNRLRSQIVTSNQRGGRRYLPYAFTEQGIAMLSAILKSDTAIKMSIQIINAFVAMRHLIASNAQIFQRLDTLEIKQLETDQKIDHVLDVMESKQIQPKQGNSGDEADEIIEYPQNPVEFLAPASDHGLDMDGDGLYDYLIVELNARTSEPGKYYLTGELYVPMGTHEENDKIATVFQVIGIAHASIYLNESIRTVAVNLEGGSIRNNQINGPYEVSISVSNETWVLAKQ